jgi:hypothetical protein
MQTYGRPSPARPQYNSPVHTNSPYSRTNTRSPTYSSRYSPNNQQFGTLTNNKESPTRVVGNCFDNGLKAKGRKPAIYFWRSQKDIDKLPKPIGGALATLPRGKRSKPSKKQIRRHISFRNFDLKKPAEPEPQSDDEDDEEPMPKAKSPQKKSKWPQAKIKSPTKRKAKSPGVKAKSPEKEDVEMKSATPRRKLKRKIETESPSRRKKSKRSASKKTRASRTKRARDRSGDEAQGIRQKKARVRSKTPSPEKIVPGEVSPKTSMTTEKKTDIFDDENLEDADPDEMRWLTTTVDLDTFADMPPEKPMLNSPAKKKKLKYTPGRGTLVRIACAS